MTLPNADISAKLAAPPKKSIFEKQKAEAEAKKAREKAETAAALEDFVKSFDDGGDQQSSFPPKRGPGDGGRGGLGAGAGGGYGSSGPGKRHFTGSGLKSGPGSLGATPSLQKRGPGSLGPMPGVGKKRHYDEYAGGRGRDRDHHRDRKDRIFTYGDDGNGVNRQDSGASARGEEDDMRDADELKAAAKPTLHLSSLPPGTSPAVIQGLFAPSPLTVDNVRILPPASGSIAERKSISAIVTLAAETPATDIDTMVSHLQNKYLGFGFNLSVSRHLSSAALTGAGSLSNNTPSSNLHNLPFGARPVQQYTSLSRAPPPGQGSGRFAPPVSYTSSTPYGSRSAANNLPPTQVNVPVPSDLKQLRLIHKMIEALLTYGPEFEALLMSRSQIQRDEQWAWLWDSRSTGGVYYRWRLWEILTDAKSRRNQRYSAYTTRQAQGDILFEGQATWIPHEEKLKFEYTTRIEEFISDEDYNSSDEEDIEEDRGGGLARRYHDHQKLGASAADSAIDNDGQGYLNPLAKTKMVHLLSRLPESNAKLRKGDVARVTGFAIEHAGAGADEVAELITRNVIHPFRYSVTKPKGDDPREDHDSEDEEHADGTPKLQPALEEGDTATADRKDTTKDTTPSSLVALYVISDILSASSTSGVRHAWRFRSLFQHHLLHRKTFETLGQIPKKYQWGKLKAEKWRRQVQVVLGLWEGWSAFEDARMKEMVESFNNPPLSKEEQLKKAEQEAEEKREKEKSINRWRSVDQNEADSGGKTMFSSAAAAGSDVEMDMDGTPMADDDEEEEDIDLTDDNIDGVPMVDSSDDEAEQIPEPPAEDDKNTPAQATETQATSSKEQETVATEPVHVPVVSQGRRMRPKAVDFDDMFE